MGKKMSNAPVYFTVTQIRYNPVLSFEKYLASIQEKMRAAGYPDFKRQQVTQVVLVPEKTETGEQQQPTLVAQTRCIFGDIKGASGFVVDNNSLAYQTTAYQTFEAFIEAFQAGIETIHGAMNLVFTERIGLRYLDAVQPSEGETVDQFLIPEVIGLFRKRSGVSVLHTFSETVFTLSAGRLVSRVVLQDGKLGLPGELIQLAPKINERFSEATGPHAIIDTDAFCESREPFDIPKIRQKMTVLHDEIDKAFRTIITPHARKTWE
jgi:uncharacterized protein (TIGR04255 family)